MWQVNSQLAYQKYELFFSQQPSLAYLGFFLHVFVRGYCDTFVLVKTVSSLVLLFSGGKVVSISAQSVMLCYGMFDGHLGPQVSIKLPHF